jgi:hypothetical protein
MKAAKDFQDNWNVWYLKSLKDFQVNWNGSYQKRPQDNWNVSYMKVFGDFKVNWNISYIKSFKDFQDNWNVSYMKAVKDFQDKQGVVCEAITSRRCARQAGTIRPSSPRSHAGDNTKSRQLQPQRPSASLFVSLVDQAPRRNVIGFRSDDKNWTANILERDDPALDSVAARGQAVL